MLTLMTLNLAHGRGVGPNQLLQPSHRFTTNLQRAAAVIREQQADVVALQEADGPTFWSGRFDHVEWLARHTGHPHRFRGNHAPQRTPLDYGTALLSTTQLQQARSRPFRTNWRDAKGFVEAVVGIDRPVRVVSVHLDFLRPAIRRRQMQTLQRELRRDLPLVLLGDFNSTWAQGVGDLASALDLRAWRPDEPSPTFPRRYPSVRIDWVLASPQLRFDRCTVVNEPVSDHCGVVVALG